MSRENISDSFVGEIYECENSSAETRVYQIAGTKNIINLEEEMLLKFQRKNLKKKSIMFKYSHFKSKKYVN